jgi:predicted double-glycine peptidase
MHAIYVIIAVSLIFVLLGLKAGRAWRPWSRRAAAAITIALIGVYLLWCRDAGWQISLLYSENTIFWGKWLPYLCGFLVGLTFDAAKKRLWFFRGLLIIFYTVSLMDIGIYFISPRPVSDRRPRGERWLTGQTSKQTCGPAACASLLNLYDYEVSEAQLIEDCLTTDRGTSLQGLWRGLKMNLSPEHEAVFVQANQIVDVPTPALIVVGLKEGADVDPRYRSEWGWIPGTEHVVVVHNVTSSGNVVVGDPSAGIEVWNLKDLDVLWYGKAIHIN